MTSEHVTTCSVLGTVLRTGLSAAVLLGAATGLAGCRGDRSNKPPRQIFPDMDDSPKWKPQSESEFFADGRTMRPAVEGAVAFGRFDFDPVAFEAKYADQPWAGALVSTRGDLLRDDDGFYRGMDSEGAYLNRMPVEVTEDLIARGKSRFNIYCTVCHGYAGDGQGLVAPSWVSPPADFHQDRYKDPTQRTGKDGYLFSVVRDGMFDAMGVQKMPGYGHALDEQDAWAVVAYLRTLQASHTTIDSQQVPDDVRRRLNAEPGGTAGEINAAGGGK
jgi:mono/diheme cytochrome c family protein